MERSLSATYGPFALEVLGDTFLPGVEGGRLQRAGGRSKAAC